MVEVTNGYATNQFVLDYSVIVDPVTTIHMPDRPPVPCRVRLVAVQSGKRIAEFEQLHHSSESFAGHEASFSSDLFEMPTGKTWVAVTNDGCRKDYVWVGGLGGIGRIDERLLIPIGAEILKWIGLGSLALGLCMVLGARISAWLFAFNVARDRR